MTITLKPEQERVLLDAVNSGMAKSAEEALDRALESLRNRLPKNGESRNDSLAETVRRLATFGERHGLSLGGMTIQELLRESRP